MPKIRCVGVLTSGGDCPGLNAAIRAIAKTAIGRFDLRVIGIRDGFRGLVERRIFELDDRTTSGILTQGGTILGTSRDKPHKMPMGDKTLDMTSVAAENARDLQIDCLFCLGGGGTQKNAFHIHSKTGLPVITLPKTIDNDVAETDTSFGFDTARAIATEAIDRLHTTATSHSRIIVCEIMGHRAGWLTLEAGIAGGADVILIPELPYEVSKVADFIQGRRRQGKRFSIVAVAEGVEPADAPKENGDKKTEDAKKRAERTYRLVEEARASRIARSVQEACGMEARVTSLGHVQRGGIPSSFDRYLCTLLGTRAVELAVKGQFNVMVAYRDGKAVPVPLEKVAGNRKTVPKDHPALEAARMVGTCFGH